ncbi:PepSY domain-containing protein [Marinobacter nauticus]|uniref:PepSY domain-containing protein n=1 Tax=Marinobacter nauticus TaxID=2743 RepID=UPI003512DFDC
MTRPRLHSSLLPADRFSRRVFRVLMLTLFAVSALPFAQVACADDDDEWRRLHHEVEAGRIKPLSEILDSLARDWRGDVIDVDIEKDDGEILYEIELLGPEGQVVEFEINARTGEVLEIEGRNIQGMKR